jgi:hypothetical protein
LQKTRQFRVSIGNMRAFLDRIAQDRDDIAEHQLESNSSIRERRKGVFELTKPLLMLIPSFAR